MTILPELPEEQDVDVTAITARPPAADRFSAAWQSETVRTDAWWYTARQRADVNQEVYLRLSPEAKERVFDGYGDVWRQPDVQDQSAEMEKILLREAANDENGGPRWHGIPTTEEEINTEVLRRRQDALTEAEAVLAIDGGGAAGLAGTFLRAATDQSSVAMAPLGLQGSLARVIAGEFALGVAGEAAILPREFAVADELGLEEPKILPRLAMGALAGGAFGGLIAGAPRAYRYLTTKREATTAARQTGTDPVDHELSVDEEYARMTDTEAPAAELERQHAQEPKTGPLKFSDFDFTPAGNASPRNNRIGYVFGKLLELGYEPHTAAGLTGNFMQESGVSLNTRAVGDGGNAYGMGQWNGPRRRTYLAFAKAQGTNPENIDTQIAFFHHEMQTSERTAAQKILAAPDAKSAALIASQAFWRPGAPHNANRMNYAGLIFRQYQDGAVPKWQGPMSSAQNSANDYTGYSTSRGYTTTGTVTAGDSTRIDVKYEVVDASLLQRASGDLQPRDRSRAASDEQIAEIAARLDPARLMPSPEADRGAPIVGPDSVVESGNGRYLAIERAAQQHPDRFAAYRKAIVDAGYEIPDGVETPVLIARRTSDLDPDARRQFIRNANTSAVARMSATERAASDAASIDNDTVGLFVPGEALSAKANKPFVTRTLAAMPQAERNALVDAKGALNAEGIARIKQALFARAYDAPDILARYAETEAGDLRALVDALEEAAPAWAAMRADVAAGLIRPELDITEFMLDAMRLIATARQIARRDGTAAAQVIKELLSDIDLLEGALHPLTAALVRKFTPNGKAAPKDKIARFLTRYADEARKIGSTEGGLFGDSPGPVQVLRALDKETFSGLPDEMPAAPVRHDEIAPAMDLEAMPDRAYAEGANSPEAKMATDLADAQLRSDVEAGNQLVRRLNQQALADLTEFKKGQPANTVDEIYQHADISHKELTGVALPLARDLGVDFVDPGLKVRKTVDEKMVRKQYQTAHQITDVVRGAFLIRKASDADAVIDGLIAKFDLIDEGWKLTEAGYTDRKLLIRTKNGILAEVQILPEKLYRSKKEGGQALYTKRRVAKNEVERTAILEMEAKLYSAAMDASDASFGNLEMSKGPKLLSNSARQSSSDSTAAVSVTSASSTATQSPSGSSIANARLKPSDTAGRSSHEENTINNTPFTQNISTPGEDVQTALRNELNEFRANSGDLEFEQPDGSTFSTREILDDLDSDADLDALIDICNMKGSA